jgi:disulfide bond formation protein DsbB
MTKRSFLILCAAGGSLALLLGAFAFQYFAGLAPCKLCIWQRWPHGAAVLIGLLALGLSRGLAGGLAGRILPLLGALAALSTAVIATYHTGVERGWWQGPDTCSSGPIADLSPQDLLAQIMAAPLARCDEVPWEMFTLSMANWNALASFALVLVWLMASRAKA